MRERQGDYIFFLTFERGDSIYESHCDFFKSLNFDRRIKLNEERNQESPCQEESRSEEKEVMAASRCGRE
jgi:hypothetical protein